MYKDGAGEKNSPVMFGISHKEALLFQVHGNREDGGTSARN